MKRFIKRSVILMCCLLVSILIMPVSVNAAAKLNQKSITLNVGKTYILKSSGTRGKITWTSSNRSVASVTSRGIVKAVKKGTVTITARYGKSKLTCKVTVKQPVTSIKLNKSSVSLEKGKTYTLKAVVSPSNANNKAVAWTRSNKSVAMVTSRGVIKAVKNGTATITATVKDGSRKKASCKITVKTTTVVPDDSTIITTAEQLFALEGKYDQKKYKLGKDINVGSYPKTISSFYGTLEGNGHKIINLNKPLFNNNFGAIRNIIFDSCNIKSENTRTCAVAVDNYGTIAGCIVKGNISTFGGGDVAAIVSGNLGTISNCTNYAKVTGNGHYTDILGNSQTRNASAAGICVENHKEIKNCTNYGEITGKEYAGGIAKYNWYGSIDHSINYGRIKCEEDDTTSFQYEGGIAAYNWDGKIYNSLNTGNVRNGLAGCNRDEDSVIQNCVNVGITLYGITEENYFGAYIVDCYYLGSTSAYGVVESQYTRFKAIEDNDRTTTSAYPTLDFTKDWTMDAQYPVPRQ